MSSPERQQGDAPLYRTCVYPFVLFIGFNLLLFVVEGGLKWDHPEAEWWRRAPEMWLYPAQTLVCAAYLLSVRRHIRWDGSWRTCLLGAFVGIVGIAFWLVPYVAGWVPAEGGFQPEQVFGDAPVVVLAEYVLRFARACLIVPVVEEFFWRGFLMRWCVDRDFPQQVAIGTHSWFAFVVTTVGFMLVHVAADYPAALVYGSLAYWLVVYTKRLMPVIVMHAVANGIMGFCAIACDLPHLW